MDDEGAEADDGAFGQVEAVEGGAAGGDAAFEHEADVWVDAEGFGYYGGSVGW